MAKKRKPQIWIQLEGGLIQAIRFPRGMEVHIMDLDVESCDGSEPDYHKSCRLCRDPHFHATQTRSDDWDVNEGAETETVPMCAYCLATDGDHERDCNRPKEVK